MVGGAELALPLDKDTALEPTSLAGLYRIGDLPVGPEFSSRPMMLKESFREVIIWRDEPGCFFSFAICVLIGAVRSRLPYNSSRQVRTRDS